MEDEKIVEQGHPRDLLQQADSQHRQVVHRQGAGKIVRGWMEGG